jgi:hypothetical protein
MPARRAGRRLIGRIGLGVLSLAVVVATFALGLVAGLTWRRDRTPDMPEAAGSAG